MADLLNEVTSKEFGRKSFLKGTGALVVTMGVAGAATAGKASADVSPYASPGPFQQDSLDYFSEFLARVGESQQPFPLANEDFDAEFILEILDVLAYSRL